MKITTIAIGCDHGGYAYKRAILDLLMERKIAIIDMGPYLEQSVDYPDHIHPVAEAIEKGEADMGIILCGSGNGAAMTANKHQGIRAALCWSEKIATLARQHNDANIISIPARFVAQPLALDMIKIFLETEFEGGRHERRINKMSCNIA